MEIDSVQSEPSDTCSAQAPEEIADVSYTTAQAIHALRNDDRIVVDELRIAPSGTDHRIWARLSFASWLPLEECKRIFEQFDGSNITAMSRLGRDSPSDFVAYLHESNAVSTR